MPAKKTVLVVDDDEAMKSMLESFLRRQGYSVFTSPSMVSALSWLEPLSKEKFPDIVLSDVHLGRGNGIDLTRLLLQRHPETPVILFSVAEEAKGDAMKSGARVFLRAPFPLGKLAEVVKRELPKERADRRPRKENE